MIGTNTKRRLASLLLPITVVIASCSDDRSGGPIAPEVPVGAPSADIVVAPDVQGLFFLNPPVGPGGTATVAFDPTLLPALFLELCEASSLDAEGRCTNLLARYTSTEAAPDGNTIQLLIDEEQYSVEVQFKNLPGADDGDVFIGRVGIGDPTGIEGTDFLVFGSFDVVLGNGQGVEDDLEANPNRTLPVKWFAGEGVVVASLGGDPTGDVGTGVVDSDGGRVETESGFYVVDVPAGAVPVGETVTITIEAKEEPTAADPCVGTFPFALQAKGCADFTAIPDITFQTEVTVGVCLDPSVALQENYQLAKDDGTSVVLLEPAEVTIDCTGFLASGIAPDFLPRFAANGLDALARGVKRLFAPRPLSASDKGFGGSTLDFSFIGWVLVPDVEIVAGDGQLAPAGRTIEVELLVQTGHFDDDEESDGPLPIPDAPLILSITGGGGVVLPPDPVVTGPDGRATALLQVGSGVNTFQASVGLDAVAFEAIGGTYQVAFHRGAVGSREIWTLLTDGTSVEAGPVQLVNLAGSDVNPKWSRAGDRIAFMSDRTGFNEIWIMDADASDPVQLTDVQAGANRPHSWGPGDTEIAFTTTRNGLFQIARLPSAGGGTFFIRDNAGSPDWSPDGQLIATEAFVSDGDGGGSNQIVVIAPDGTNEVNLSDDLSVADLRPDWSPDGTEIAFTRFDPEGDKGDIWVMGADGSGQVNLTPNTPGSDDLDPVWSPDGQFVAFFSDRDEAGNFDLYVMAADGTGVVRLTTDPAFDGAPDFRF